MKPIGRPYRSLFVPSDETRNRVDAADAAERAIRDEPEQAVVAAKRALASAEKLAGSSRTKAKRVRLEVLHPWPIQIGGRDWIPRNDVPATRADCPKERPCVHARCEWHTWFQAAEDVPGRRWTSKTPPPTIRPGWLEANPPPSCTLDIIATYGPMSSRQIAKLFGSTTRAVEYVVRSAIDKLAAAGADKGDIESMLQEIGKRPAGNEPI